MQVKREVKLLRRKVEHLGVEVVALKEYISKVGATSVTRNMPQQWAPDRTDSVALKYLSVRLANYLMKPLTSSRPGSVDARRSQGRMVQEVLKRSADCSLFELDIVADHIKNVMGGQGVEFIPPYDEFQKELSQEMCFSFNSFEDLAKVFGPLSKSDLQSCTVRTKVDRSTGSVTMLRLLGSVIHDPNRPDTPTFLAIGFSVSGSEPAGTPRKLWKRENGRWNHGDGAFACPLEPVEVMSQEVPELLREVQLPVDKLQELADASRFCIRWKRDGVPGTRRFFQTLPRSVEVLGRIEVSIPQVTVRGMQAHIMHNLFS